MNGYSPGIRTYLSQRVKRRRRNLAAAGVEFAKRRALLSAQPTLNSEIVVKVLGTALGPGLEKENGGNGNGNGKESQKRTAGTGVKEIEKKVRFNPNSKRQPGQVLKLHVTAKDLASGEPNFGWIDSPPALSPQEASEGMRQALAWKHRQPKIRVRRYDKNPRTGEPILETEQEVSVKSLGPSLRDSMGGAASLGGRAASKLGLLVDELGKFRCPPGTPAANQFTDSFGANCFNPIGLMRDAAGGITDWFDRHTGGITNWFDRRVEIGLQHERDYVMDVYRYNVAVNAANLDASRGDVIGTYETMDAAWEMREQVLAALKELHASGVDSEMNEDLWTVLAALGDPNGDVGLNLDWEGLFTGLWGKQVDENGELLPGQFVYNPDISMKENLILQRTQITDEVLDFLEGGGMLGAKDAYYQGDPDVREIVSRYLDDHEQVMRGTLGSLLDEVDKDPEGMAALKRVGFRSYQKHLEPGGFEDYWSTAGECRPLYNGAGEKGLACEVEFNPGALIFEGLLIGNEPLIPADGQKLTLVDTFPGYEHTDAARWAKINDFLKAQALRDRFDQGSRDAFDIEAKDRVGGLEKQAAFVAYHEFAHVRQYSQMQNRIMDAYTANGNQFTIMAHDGTGWVPKQLLEDPSEWSSGDWANAVNTVFFNDLPQGVDFPPVDLDSLEGTMLAHVAGARIQREINKYHRMEMGGESQEAIQGQINLIMMEAMAELEASRRMGLIEGPGVDAFLAWMHEPPSKHIGVVPAENLSYKPLPVWATDGPVLKPSDLGPPSWDQDLPSGYEITPSGLIMPVAPDVKPDSRVQPIDGVDFVPPAPTIAPGDWDYFDEHVIRQRMGMPSTTDPIQFGNMPDPEMDSRPMGLGYGERMPTKSELRQMSVPEFRTWLEGERQKIGVADVSDPAYPHTALLHRNHMQDTDMVNTSFFDDLPGKETGLAGVIPDSRRSELDALKDDIRANGFREPLKVHYNPETGDVNLGDGDMRLAAARELGMQSIPTRISVTTRSRVDADDRKTVITGALADVKDGRPSDLGMPTTRIDSDTRKLQMMKTVYRGGKRDRPTRSSAAPSPTDPSAHWGPGGMRSAAAFIAINSRGGLVDDRDWGPAGLSPERRKKLPRADRKRFKQLEKDFGGAKQQLDDTDQKLKEANDLPFGEGPWGTGYAGINTPDSGWWDNPDNRARMAAVAEATEEYEAAQGALDAIKLEMYEIDDSIFQFDRGFQKRQGVGAYSGEEMELRANRVEERGGMRSASFIAIYGQGGLVDERDWGPAGLDPKRRSKLPRKDRKRFKQLEKDFGGAKQQLDDLDEKFKEANDLPFGEGPWGTGYAGINTPDSGWWDNPDNRAKMAAIAEVEGELDAVKEAMDAIKLEMYEIDDSTFPFDRSFQERHGTGSARTPTSGDDDRGGMRSQKGIPGLSTPLEERPASGGRKERDAEDVGWSKEVMDMPDSEWDEQLSELETVHNGDPGFLNDEEYGKMLQLRDRQIAEHRIWEEEQGNWDDAIEMTDDQLEKRIVDLKFYREKGLTDEEADQLVVLEAEDARRDAEWIAQEAEEAAFDLETRAEDAAMLMDDISNMGEAEMQAEIEDLEAKKARGDKLVPEEKEALARLQSELGNAQDARAEFDEARLEAHQSPLEMTEQEVIDEIDSLYNTEWDAPGRKLDDIDEHRREELMEYQRRMEDQVDPREMSDEELLGEIAELYGRRELDDTDAAYLSKLEHDSERPTRKMNTRQSGRPETREEMDARQRYGGNSWQAREARRNVELREAERREEFEARRRGGMRSSRIESSTGENGPKLKPRPPGREWDKSHDLVPDRFHKNGHWVEEADGHLRFKKYDKETLREVEQLNKRRQWLRRSEGKNENIDRELGEIDQRIANIGSTKRAKTDTSRGGMRSSTPVQGPMGKGLTPEEIDNHSILDPLEKTLEELEKELEDLVGDESGIQKLINKILPGGDRKDLEQRIKRHKDSIERIKEALADGRFVENMDAYEALTPEQRAAALGADKPLVITGDQTELAMRMILDSYELNKDESDADKLMHVKIVPTDSLSGEHIQSLLHREFAEAIFNEDIEADAFFDMCKVSVAGSNMFCYDHKDILRNSMPQFSGDAWDFSTEEHQALYETALARAAKAAGHTDPSTDGYEDWFKSADGWEARLAAHQEVKDAGGTSTAAMEMWHQQHAEATRRLAAKGITNDPPAQKVDKDGSLVFKLDKDGIHVLDEDGNPVPVMEKTLREQAAASVAFGADSTRLLVDHLRKNGVTVNGGFGMGQHGLGDLRVDENGNPLSTAEDGPVQRALNWLKASQNQLIGPKVMKEARKATIRTEDADGNVTYVKNPDHWLFSGPNGSAEPILVTSDGYILDGHHRWAMLVAVASLTGEEGAIEGEMNVIVVDLPVNEALAFGVAFADELGMQRAPAKGGENPEHPAKPGALKVPAAEEWTKMQATIAARTEPAAPQGTPERGGMRSSGIRRNEPRKIDGSGMQKERVEAQKFREALREGLRSSSPLGEGVWGKYVFDGSGTLTLEGSAVNRPPDALNLDPGEQPIGFNKFPKDHWDAPVIEVQNFAKPFKIYNEDDPIRHYGDHGNNPGEIHLSVLGGDHEGLTRVVILEQNHGQLRPEQGPNEMALQRTFIVPSEHIQLDKETMELSFGGNTKWQQGWEAGGRENGKEMSGISKIEIGIELRDGDEAQVGDRPGDPVYLRDPDRSARDRLRGGASSEARALKAGQRPPQRDRGGLRSSRGGMRSERPDGEPSPVIGPRQVPTDPKVAEAGLVQRRRRTDEIKEKVKDAGGVWGFVGMTLRERRDWVKEQLGREEHEVGASLIGGIDSITNRRETAATRIQEQIEEATKQLRSRHHREEARAFFERTLDANTRILDYLNNHTDAELYEQMVAVLRAYVDDPDTQLAVNIPWGSRWDMFLQDRYRTIHEVRSSHGQDGGYRVGVEAQQGVAKHTPKDLRPPSGYLVSGDRRRLIAERVLTGTGPFGEGTWDPSVQYPELHEQSLNLLRGGADTYGEVQLVLHDDIKDRSLFGVGDSVNQAVRAAPMRDATDDQLLDAALITEFGGGIISGESTAKLMRMLEATMHGTSSHIGYKNDALTEEAGATHGETYTEAFILGSFDIRDVAEVVIPPRNARGYQEDFPNDEVRSLKNYVAGMPTEIRDAAKDLLAMDPEELEKLLDETHTVGHLVGMSHRLSNLAKREEIRKDIHQRSPETRVTFLHEHAMDLDDPRNYGAKPGETIRDVLEGDMRGYVTSLIEKAQEKGLVAKAPERGGMRSARGDKRSKKRVAVRKRKEAFRKGWKAAGGPTLDEFLDDLLEVDGPKGADQLADELADDILGGIGKLIKRRVPGMRSATSASAVSHQRERRISAIDAQREGLEAARTNLLGRLGNARLNNNTEKANELTEALDDLQGTLRPLSPERRSLVKQRDSRTRGRGMRSIKTTRTSKDPNTAQRMKNRNTSVQAGSGTAFSAPPGWKEPRKNKLIQSQQGSKLVPKIQSRQDALAEHRQHLMTGVRDFIGEMRRGEIVGPRGFYRDVHPDVVEFLSAHSDEDVLTALDTAATLWHRGFDRRVRIPLDNGELDDLFKNRSHHRPHQAVGKNAASDLRANYDLSNGIELSAPAEARPINGYLYHATHDDAVDKHLNDLAGPQLERYADLWDPGVEGAPWGNAHSMGGDIDLVLRPEASDRTHYTNGSAMYRQGVPVPMNSDNPAEILAALIPLNQDGEKQPHAVTANNVSQLLEAGITGDWTNYANRSATYIGAPGTNPLTPRGRPTSLSNEEHHQAQVLGGVQLDDIEFVRYPIDKANWRSRLLTDDDVGRNDKSSLAALRNAGFSDSEIDYFYAAVRDGRVSGLHNATWLKQALAAQDAKVRFDRMGVDVMFTNPDGIDLLNVDTFMSGLTNLNISGETAPEVLRKRIRMEIINRAEELLLDVRREISPRKNDSKRTLV